MGAVPAPSGWEPLKSTPHPILPLWVPARPPKPKSLQIRGALASAPSFLPSHPQDPTWGKTRGSEGQERTGQRKDRDPLSFLVLCSSFPFPFLSFLPIFLSEKLFGGVAFHFHFLFPPRYFLRPPPILYFTDITRIVYSVSRFLLATHTGSLSLTHTHTRTHTHPMLVNPGREKVPAGSAARGSLPLRDGDPGRLADRPTSPSPAAAAARSIFRS